MDEDTNEDKLLVGHEGVGDDCLGKVVDHSWKFALAGKSLVVGMNLCDTSAVKLI